MICGFALALWHRHSCLCIFQRRGKRSETRRSHPQNLTHRQECLSHERRNAAYSGQRSPVFAPSGTGVFM